MNNPGWGYFSFVCIFAVSINLVGDYLSLWETRIIIGRMGDYRLMGQKSKSKCRSVCRVSFLLIDLIASVLIFFSTLLLGLLLSSPIMIANESLSAEDVFLFVSVSFQWIVEYFLEGGITFSHSDPSFDPITIFFYTTLFTSIWAWAFMCGSICWPVYNWLRNLLGSFDTSPDISSER